MAVGGGSLEERVLCKWRLLRTQEAVLGVAQGASWLGLGLGVVGSMVPGEAEELQSLGSRGLWIAKPGGVGKGGQQLTCLPRGVQRRRCQEKCVKERGSGPAFMLLYECLRAWREPLRMAALCSKLLSLAKASSLCSELLLHAKT